MPSQIRPLVSPYDCNVGFGLAVGRGDRRLNPNCPIWRQNSSDPVIDDLYDAIMQRIVSHLWNNPSLEKFDAVVFTQDAGADSMMVVRHSHARSARGLRLFGA